MPTSSLFLADTNRVNYLNSLAFDGFSLHASVGATSKDLDLLNRADRRYSITRLSGLLSTVIVHETGA